MPFFFGGNMKNKVINLDNDLIFKHSVKYKDTIDYTGKLAVSIGKIDPDDEKREIPNRRSQGGDLRSRDTAKAWCDWS